MKKSLLLILAVFIFSACESFKGDKGDKGDRGDPGIMTSYTGNITSDAQTVSAPMYAASSNLSVYVGSNTVFQQVPFYDAPNNQNVNYAVDIASITIFNALTGGFDGYKIIVINQGTVRPAKYLLGN